MYYELMIDNNDEVSDRRIQTLREIERDKAHVVWAYNKKVKGKLFQAGDLVWMNVLPLGVKSSKFSKVVSKLGRSI